MAWASACRCAWSRAAQRSELLRALHLDKAAAKEPLRYATLACGRRLTAGSPMQLV